MSVVNERATLKSKIVGDFFSPLIFCGQKKRKRYWLQGGIQAQNKPLSPLLSGWLTPRPPAPWPGATVCQSSFRAARV